MFENEIERNTKTNKNFEPLRDDVTTIVFIFELWELFTIWKVWEIKFSDCDESKEESLDLLLFLLSLLFYFVLELLKSQYELCVLKCGIFQWFKSIYIWKWEIETKEQ